VRFPAFNMRTTPELNGEVSRVMRITLPDHELVRLMRQTLVPGMPVESFIRTGERTVIAYRQTDARSDHAGVPGEMIPNRDYKAWSAGMSASQNASLNRAGRRPPTLWYFVLNTSDSCALLVRRSFS